MTPRRTPPEAGPSARPATGTSPVERASAVGTVGGLIAAVPLLGPSLVAACLSCVGVGAATGLGATSALPPVWWLAGLTATAAGAVYADRRHARRCRRHPAPARTVVILVAVARPEPPAERIQRSERRINAGDGVIDHGRSLRVPPVAGTRQLPPRGDVSDAGVELVAAGFAALWHARLALPAERLPGRDGLVAELIAALVQHGRVEIDQDRRLIGIHGLTVRTTHHRFVHGGRVHHTWCAFDSIGIPAALQVDATAHTDCRTCGRPLTVEIHRGIPRDTGLALWLPGSTGGNLIANFCARAHL